MAKAVHQPDVAALNWIIASAVAVMVPHATRFPLWLTLALAGLFAWRYAGLHHGWYQPGRILRLALALLLSAAVFKEYGTLLGRDAGMAMLVGLLALKFIEARSVRDYLLVLFLLYLLVAGDFLHSQSLAHGAYMVAVVVLCTATLIRLNLDHARNPQFNFRLAVAMLARALPLLLIMYLLFPRLQGGLWGLPSDAYAGKTGLSDSMRPGSINQLSLSTEPAFRVEFAGKRPANRELYWRALVMWDTDGREWRAGQPLALEPGPVTRVGDLVNYTITLEPSNKPWLVALDRPLTTPAIAFARAGWLIQSRTLLNKRVRYDMRSQGQHRPKDLTPEARKRGLALARDSSERTRRLAAEWRAQYPDDRGVAEAALKYFNQNEFVYTLKPPLFGRDPVDEFLFGARRGFCEHYATAFVTLMRAAGIPARIVVGYQGGEYNETGNYMIVRQSDAHSWAEIWIRNEGWVRVDPTAAIAPERIELGIDAVQRLNSQGLPLGNLSPEMLRRAMALGMLARAWRGTRLAWDAFNLQWYNWVADYGWARQERFLQSLGMNAPTWLGMLAGLMGAITLITFALAQAIRLRRRPRDPVVIAFNKFCRELARSGLVRKPSEGARDFAERSARQLPGQQKPILAVATIYNELRYGAGSKGSLAKLQKMVKELRLPKRGAA